MNFRPVIQTGPGAAVPAASRTPDDQLPKPTAEPANSSDENWITPEVYKQFEALDCDNPSQDKQQRSDPTKPLVTCEPASANSPAIKYILGPVEVKGSNIKSSSFQLQRGAQGAVTNEWAVNIQFDDAGTTKFKEITERLYEFYAAGGGQTGSDPKSQFAIVLDDQVHLRPALPRRHHRRPGRRSPAGSPRSRPRPSPTSSVSVPCRSASKSRANRISATLGGEQLRMGTLPA